MAKLRLKRPQGAPIPPPIPQGMPPIPPTGPPGFAGGSKKVKGYAKGSSGIFIKPSHKGLFTAKAKSAGSSVQGYASKVLAAPKGKFSPSTRKQANFAKNFGGRR
jgi:hypothetical protein